MLKKKRQKIIAAKISRGLFVNTHRCLGKAASVARQPIVQSGEEFVEDSEVEMIDEDYYLNIRIFDFLNDIQCHVIFVGFQIYQIETQISPKNHIPHSNLITRGIKVNLAIVLSKKGWSNNV